MSNYSRYEITNYFDHHDFESIMVTLTLWLTNHFAPYYKAKPGMVMPLDPKEVVTIVPKNTAPSKLQFEFWFGKELICVVKYEGEEPSITAVWLSETPIEDVLDNFESFLAEMKGE